MVTAAIHQPNFLPWGGYFKKILTADKFILLDDVQYSKNSFINRNRIKTPQSDLWLTVPVLTRSRSGQLIKEVEIDNRQDWRKKHQATLKQNYSKAPFFDEIFELIELWYQSDYQLLLDFNKTLIEGMCIYLGIKTETCSSSDFRTTATATDRLVQLCQEVEADVYLFGGGAVNYQEAARFEEAGIGLRDLSFANQPYHQLWGEFRPSLSIIDALFNLGQKARSLLE